MGAFCQPRGATEGRAGEKLLAGDCLVGAMRVDLPRTDRRQSLAFRTRRNSGGVKDTKQESCLAVVLLASTDRSIRTVLQKHLDALTGTIVQNLPAITRVLPSKTEEKCRTQFTVQNSALRNVTLKIH